MSPSEISLSYQTLWRAHFLSQPWSKNDNLLSLCRHLSRRFTWQNQIKLCRFASAAARPEEYSRNQRATLTSATRTFCRGNTYPQRPLGYILSGLQSSTVWNVHHPIVQQREAKKKPFLSSSTAYRENTKSRTLPTAPSSAQFATCNLLPYSRADLFDIGPLGSQLNPKPLF